MQGPRIGRRALEAALHRLGVQNGGILLAHSSLAALGFVVGGPKTVIGALLDAIGPKGTLVFPTHTWEWVDSGCRIFDVCNTKCCVGAIPEAFRSFPGMLRSLHPTHSVAAVGPEAKWLINGHEHSPTPCGEGTPYARLLERDGQILLLGTGLQSNTAFHTIEALVEARYLLRDEPDEFTIIDQFGRKHSVSVRCHLPGVARCFPAMESMLLNQGIAKKGRVGSGPALLIAGLAFRNVMMRALQETPTLLLATALDDQASRQSGEVLLE